MDKDRISNPLFGRYAPLPLSAREYIGAADSAALRALILILTSPDGAALDRSTLDGAGLTRAEFERGAAFWRERGVLPGQSADPSDPAAAGPSLPAAPSVVIDASPAYDTIQIADDMDSNEALRRMLTEAQSILGKTLGSGEVCTLYGLYDWLRLTPEAVLLLIEYCASHGKRGIKYIEKTAIEWSKAGVSDADSARRHIELLRREEDSLGHIRKLLGISGRDLTPTERRIASRWAELGVDDETILLAYDKTVANTGKLAMAYMDKVVDGLLNDEKKSPAAAEKAPKPRRAAPGGQAPSRTRLDYGEFERISLKNLMEKK